MKEIWKYIKGYEGLYRVSNLGNINRIGKGNLSLKSNQRYIRVCLSKNGCIKYYSVHRLVAEAFVSNPNGFTEVNHINENKHDNRACNLEWCNREYNNNYGTHQERCIKGKHKKLYQYDLNGNLIKIWGSRQKVQKNGFPSIYKALREFNGIYKGYKFSNELINLKP